jgi:hypothetical protein
LRTACCLKAEGQAAKDNATRAVFVKQRLRSSPKDSNSYCIIFKKKLKTK